MLTVPDKNVAFSSRLMLSITEEMGKLGVWSHNVNTCKSFWSPGIHRMLGTDPAIDKPSLETFLRNVHPDDSKKLSDLYELSRQGVVLEQKFRVIHPNGHMRWLTSRSEILYSKDGFPLQIVGLVIDTTEQQSLLELFGRKEKRLDALAEGYHFSLWSADKNGALTSLQQWRSLGIDSCSRFMGWNWLQFVPEDERRRTRAGWRRAIARGKRFTSDIKLALNGVEEPVGVTVYAGPVSTDGGKILEWAGLFVRPGHVPDVASDLGEVKAAHIRAARALLDWSIEDLSAASGISISSIRRVEHGEASSIRGQTVKSI